MVCALLGQEERSSVTEMIPEMIRRCVICKKDQGNVPESPIPFLCADCYKKQVIKK